MFRCLNIKMKPPETEPLTKKQSSALAVFLMEFHSLGDVIRAFLQSNVWNWPGIASRSIAVYMPELRGVDKMQLLDTIQGRLVNTNLSLLYSSVFDCSLIYKLWSMMCDSLGIRLDALLTFPYEANESRLLVSIFYVDNLRLSPSLRLRACCASCSCLMYLSHRTHVYFCLGLLVVVSVRVGCRKQVRLSDWEYVHVQRTVYVWLLSNRGPFLSSPLLLPALPSLQPVMIWWSRVSERGSPMLWSRCPS